MDVDGKGLVLRNAQRFMGRERSRDAYLFLMRKPLHAQPHRVFSMTIDDYF